MIEKKIELKIKENIVIVFSVFSLFFLFIPANLLCILVGMLMGGIVSLFCIYNRVIVNYAIRRKDYYILFLLSPLIFGKFYFRWIDSSKLKYIANIFGLNHSIFLVTATIILLVLSGPMLLKTIHYIASVLLLRKTTQYQNFKRKNALLEIIVLFLIAIITITIFSKSSFLYPMNDWVDANCFFTVGKSILYGKVPYRDLCEQKGPLLYFIHAVAALISSDSFLGVYFIEVLACYGFLFYSYKTLFLFSDSKWILYIMPAFSWLVYSSTGFCHGDSAEELCLPFLAYALFVGTKYFKTDVIPNVKECLIIGLTSACVLWIKYSLLGFYIGWIILPACVLFVKKQYKQLFKIIGTIVLGVSLVSIPILIYFVHHKAIEDLFTVYFYNNMFLYGTKGEGHGWIFNVFYNLSNALSANLFLLISLLLGVIGIWYEKRVFLNVYISFVFTSLFIFCSSVSCLYYPFILNVFAIFGMILLVALLEHVQKRIIMPFIVAANICTFMICFFHSSNTYLMLEDKDNLPQYKFQKIIGQIDNPTLLNYGFLDGGFYTVCNIVPNCEYFCQLNIQLDEMYEMQNKYVEEGMVDFVVTRDAKLVSPNYDQIAMASYYFEGKIRDYYLYQLVQNE